MTSSTTYDKNCDLLVDILAEMVVSYFAKKSNGVEKKENNGVKDQSIPKGENLNANSGITTNI